MTKPTKVFLDGAEWLEFRPVTYRPTTGDERLAAIVGYMIGDGAVTTRSATFKKKDGSTSVYKPHLSGAFYSNEKADLQEIKDDLVELGLSGKASVTMKKTPAHLDDGYQLQISRVDCKELVDAGVPVGKKTLLTFDVPPWIKESSEASRAFLAALFGAEATTPAVTKGGVRTMRPIVMTMFKIAPTDAGAFFTDVQTMLCELGVKSSVTTLLQENYGKTYVGYSVRISGLDNTIAFLQNVGFGYCQKKATMGWKWLQYLKAYRKRASDRRATVLAMSEAGESFKAIGASIGLTRGAAFRLLKDIKDGKGNTAGHDFPEFDEWMKERWIESVSLLRLKVSSCVARPEKEEVWNLLVTSPDHSYLLANGANNFNSFETMSGRVYYPFDRGEHVGQYAFNPTLPIWVGMDFNIDPMSAVIFQPQPDGEIWAVDEIVQFGSNTEEICKELDRKYWRIQNQITMYPDPAGGQRQHARGETDLDILRENNLKKIKFRRKHPPVADRVNSVNRMLRAADGTVKMRIDARCKHLITALEQTIYKAGSRDVDKDAGTEHSADAAGYCIELEYPVRKVNVMGLSF